MAAISQVQKDGSKLIIAAHDQFDWPRDSTQEAVRSINPASS